MQDFMNRVRPWLNRALWIGVILGLCVAHYSYVKGEILDALYFMISVTAMLMMASMTDYEE